MRGRSSGSEGGCDKAFRRGAPSERKSDQPGFSNDNDAWQSGLARKHRWPASSSALPAKPVENIFPGMNHHADAGKPLHPDGAATAAIRALFKAVKEVLAPKEEDTPKPARRRRGEAGRGFASTWRTMLTRAPRHERGRPEATAMGGHATFADICAEAGAFLSETLDYLNPWHDSCANDLWQEEEFNATYWDNFPQP